MTYTAMICPWGDGALTLLQNRDTDFSYQQINAVDGIASHDKSRQMFLNKRCVTEKAYLMILKDRYDSRVIRRRNMYRKPYRHCLGNGVTALATSSSVILRLD